MKALIRCLGLSTILASAALVMSLRSVGDYTLTGVRVGPLLIDKDGLAVGAAIRVGPRVTRFGDLGAHAVSLSSESVVLEHAPTKMLLGKSGLQLARAVPVPQRLGLEPMSGLSSNHGCGASISAVVVDVWCPGPQQRTSHDDSSFRPAIYVHATNISAQVGYTMGGIFHGVLLDGMWHRSAGRRLFTSAFFSPQGVFGLPGQY